MKNERMAALARRKNPDLARLASLGAYRRLSPAARALVRAIVINGQDVAAVLSATANGGRTWNSEPVRACLTAFGWKARRLMEDRQQEPAGPAPSQPPARQPVPCLYCGEPSGGDYRGQPACPACMCRECGILPTETEPPPIAVPEAQPVVPANERGTLGPQDIWPGLTTANIEAWANQAEAEFWERERLIREIEDGENRRREETARRLSHS